MNDKQRAEKAERLTTRAESGDNGALSNELNNMSPADRLDVAQKMDAINARHRAKDSNLPDIVVTGNQKDLAELAVQRRDGSVARVTPGEGVVVKRPDGKIQFTVDANGNKRAFDYDSSGRLNSVTEEDGRTWTSTDGKTWTTADGSIWKGTIHTWNCGTYNYETSEGKSTTKYPDGTLNVREPDGRSVTTYPDGKVSETRPDGTYTESRTDGRSITVYPDGKLWETRKDGTATLTMPDGQKMEFESVKNSDGTITWRQTQSVDLGVLSHVPSVF